MVKSFQEKFNEYQNSENDQKIQIESKLFESLYDGLKKQARKILEDKKDNPDILAMDFVLGLVDECHKQKKTTGVDKIQINNIVLLIKALNNFAESGKFKYDGTIYARMQRIC